MGKLKNIPRVTVSSNSLRNIASSNVNSRGIRTTVPYHIDTGQIGKVGMIEVEGQKWAPFAAFAFDPVEIHVFSKKLVSQANTL